MPSPPPWVCRCAPWVDPLLLFHHGRRSVSPVLLTTTCKPCLGPQAFNYNLLHAKKLQEAAMKAVSTGLPNLMLCGPVTHGYVGGPRLAPPLLASVRRPFQPVSRALGVLG